MKGGLKSVFRSFLHPRASRRENHGDSQDGINEMQAALEGINGRLESLFSCSEKDFLAIGSRLQDIYTLSTNMSVMASNVVDAMTGEKIIHAIDGLERILAELKGHIETSESGFDNISLGLKEYRETVEEVSSYFEKFRMLVLNLEMLGFFTRVENAHIYSGDTGFSSLTNDVKALSKRILEKSSQIQTKSLTLSDLISQASAEFSRFKESHKTHARTMLGRSVSNHKILVSRHRSATGSAQNTVIKSQDIQEKIGEIVSSLQFQDITSQQIQHVRTVLDMLTESLGSPELSDAEKSGLINEVCSLQGAQISNTRKEAYEAIENVIGSMETISGRIKELLDETRNVTWASDVDGLTFMEELDSGISTVIECLDENISEQAGLTSTMSSVSTMVSEMSLFVDEIENLGLNLQLIALNARIKAAHIGNEGAALGTISGSIYELSKNSREDTNVLSGILSGVVDIARHFDTNLEAMHNGQEQGVAQLVTELKDLLHALHDMNDSVFSMLIEMNSMGEALRGEIENAVSGISIHGDIKEVLGEVIEELDGISRRSKEMHPSTDKTSSSPFMKELEKYYTMESEFKVHADHAGEGDLTALDASQSPSEYGDNVELF